MAGRRWICALLFLSAAWAAADPVVEVSRPVYITVSTPHDLQSECGTVYAVAGCTRFLDEHLSCGCVLDGATWRIESRATFGPAIYIAERLGQNRGVPTTAHELMHIRDVTDRLRRYLTSLDSISFDSEAECRRAATATMDPRTFASLMNRFRYESNVKYLCIRPAPTP